MKRFIVFGVILIACIIGSQAENYEGKSFYLKFYKSHIKLFLEETQLNDDENLDKIYMHKESPANDQNKVKRHAFFSSPSVNDNKMDENIKNTGEMPLNSKFLGTTILREKESR